MTQKDSQLDNNGKNADLFKTDPQLKALRELQNQEIDNLGKQEIQKLINKRLEELSC